MGGSAIVELPPTEHVQAPNAQPIRLRMITYQFKDPALGDRCERHRLITMLLDPDQYPALDLVCAYHDRWEIELVIDELDTHQRVVGRPLRSQHPVGVLQELYGLLLAHFLVRLVIHEAALYHTVDQDRINIADD